MMPGTTYTRTGPAGDPIGRLADFARFAVAELEAIRDEPRGDDALPVIAVTQARGMLDAARRLAASLDGYTTAGA